MICRICSEELYEENWYNSCKKYHNYICKSCFNRINLKYNRDNPDVRRRYSTSDKGKIARKRYYDTHKEYYRKYWSSEKGKFISRMNKLNRFAVHNFTKDEWDIKLKQSNGICQRCNKFVGIPNLTLDHIIPIRAVPINFIYNIEDVQPLCKSCNSSKSDKIEVDIIYEN